jgi:uncharacterized membrane protein YkoI
MRAHSHGRLISVPYRAMNQRGRGKEAVMTRKKAALLAATVLAGAAVGTGFAIAGGEDENGDSDEALTGAVARRASAAALGATGGGTVLEVERGDDGAAYEVEIRKSDGTVAEVQLDRGFDVTGVAAGDD